MKGLSLFLLLLSIQALAQKGSVFSIDSLPKEGIVLNQGWKWHAGDDPDFSKMDFDDSNWDPIDPSQDLVDLPQLQKAEIGWLRLKIRLSSTLLSHPMMLNIQQATATEIYVDGKKKARYGTIDSSRIIAVYTVIKLLDLPIAHDSVVLAVRVACQKGLPRSRFAGQGNYCFSAKLTPYSYLDTLFFKSKEQSGYALAKTSSFTILFILHFMFFLFYPSQKTHLYFFGMAFFFAIHHFIWLMVILSLPVLNITWLLYLGLIRVPTLGVGYSLLLTAIYAILGYKKDLIFWIVLFLTLLLTLNGFLNYKTGIPILESFTILINSIAAIYITIKGLLDKKRFAKLLLVGIFLSLVGCMARWLPYYGFFPEFLLSPLSTFFELIGILSIPMCVSILLGQDFARTSKNLQQKLDEVQHLSEEKQQILSAQKETLEYQVKERTEELSLKNRELEIETALERVRVLMMQMQHSHELPNTTAKIFDELKGLNLLPADAALMLSLIDPEKGVSKHWATGEEFQGEAEEHQIPMHEHPLLIQTLEAWKQQEPVLIRDLSGTELHEFLQYLLNLPALKNSDLVKNRWTPLPDRLIWTETTFSQGLLSVLSSVPLAEESISIQTRFAKVFEMTYRRFLELQKAENQAREAQIEAALETVRSRTMAMHKSEELQDVVNAIFEQFKVLKIEISTANILVFLENSQDINCWTSNYKDRSFHIPFANVPVLMDLHQAKQNGQKLLSKSYTIGDKNQLFEYFFEKTDFRDIPAERQKQIFSSDKYALSSAFSSNVAIQLTSYSRDSFSEGENKILLRFADAFFQAYTRFLDLQKVENQAREAQIEVALERVRSRTMAMYKSEELSEVAAVLFQQIRLLGELPDRLSIGIFEEENDRAQVWTTDQTGFQLSGRFFARLDEETSVQKMYPCWKSGQKTQIIDLQGEEFKKWLKFVKEELKINVDETRFQGRRVHNIAYFSHGWLDVLALEPISQEMLGILLRFANVFSLSYTRFLDLQRAEKQTREARIEASLVRIRAEIASMRGPEDLQHITPLIWKELTTLQVPFFRCGVFIVDEALEKVHTYLSTPDGQAIASFYLPFDSEGPTSQIVAHWRKQQIFLDDWDELQFQAWAQSLVKQGVIPSSETYTSYMPARLFLHFIPFLQGMLYVGGEAPLTPEETQVVQSLTAAFATAYARYQDFTKLEAAKQQVESTLKELQATQAQLIQAEKLASLGELTAGIAHEIQNPLNFVNNFAEVSTEMLDEMKEEIKAGNTSEVIAIADYLEQNLTKINHHGQRASSIVKGMLEHSRASTGRDAMHRVSTDINALADEYLRLAYHGLRAKDDNFNCKLETHFDSDLPLVSVIPQDIGRVLLNLINNAFYAVAERSRSTVAERSRSTVGAPLAGAPTPYQPTVTVSTQKTDDQIIISVQDNGDGIPEAIHNKIFQPFFTTKPTGQGTGLGLSLAYDIVTKGHGGKFNFQSNPGQGTTFFIWLPIPG